MEKEQTKSKSVAKTTLLQMGWTQEMISAFLPAPWLVRNPHYGNAAKMKLWPKASVDFAMASDAYQDTVERLNRQRIAGMKSIFPKEDDLIHGALSLAERLTLADLTEDEIRESTLESKRAWYQYGMENGLAGEKDFENGMKKHLDHWIIVHALYSLSDLDEFGHYILSGRFGKGAAYLTFKIAILEKIAAKYPFVADRCATEIEELKTIFENHTRK